ncbi:muscle M-line assembly protein unc-89 [Drosophila ficusphila]|uniref:muscle M-line assembly protein unc-89 n=1 Tax=Drosophila ficusphila TaxID=30025 RepID=UPI0007E83563|nr:muscle M-line assembly protein unc-89 [Drosophila ficusphila]
MKDHQQTAADNETDKGDPAEDDANAAQSTKQLKALEKFMDLNDQQLSEKKSTGSARPVKKATPMELDIYDDLDELKPSDSTGKKDTSLNLDIYNDLDEVKEKDLPKSEKRDISLDFAMYDDLTEIKSKEPLKLDEKSKTLELDIYDDLDDFQEAEDQKTKELQEWEAKYERAQAEIQELKTENKALGKKIKVMEVNLQNLLDTAKAEVKRKEALIAQLRNEKDDLCFRRKRGRAVEESEEKLQESKRPKESLSRTVAKNDAEKDKNPFKTFPKDHDVKKAPAKEDTKKSDSRRSKSPKTNERRSSTHSRRPESRNKSKDRHRSRSRSPKHTARRDQQQSRENSSRQNRKRSRTPSPRNHSSKEKSQAKTTMHGNKKNELHADEMTQMETELALSRKVVPKLTGSNTSEIKKNYSCEPKEQCKEIAQNTNGFFSEVCKPTHENIPGLDFTSKPVAAESVNFTIKETKPVKKHDNNRSKNGKQDKSKDSIQGLDLEGPKDGEKRKESSGKHSKTKVLQLDHLERHEKQAKNPNTKLDKESNNTHEDFDNPAATNEGIIDQAEPTKTSHEYNDNSKTSSGKPNCSPTENHSELKSDVESEVGVRIIEDIRLPKIADIDHIALKVDQQCRDQMTIANCATNEPSCGLVDKIEQDLVPSLEESNEPTPTSSSDDAPLKSATVLYAKPDSTKLDHNDENDEIVLEAAMDLLTNEQDAPIVAAPTYPNLSIEEDAIEMALEQLHQQSPDETVVTSTSNRASQAQSLKAILSQSPTQRSPSKSKVKSAKTSPLVSPIKTATEKTPLKKRKINLESPTEPSPVVRLDFSAVSQDVTIDETLQSSLGEDPSTVTKRCSLGHTDYQYEQVNDEVILRVKRRCRRRRPTPMEIQTGDKPI